MASPHLRARLALEPDVAMIQGTNLPDSCIRHLVATDRMDLQAVIHARLFGYPMSHLSCPRKASGRAPHHAALWDRASAGDTDGVAGV